MARAICLINGHPDPAPERFCAALCTSYEEAARASGHTVHRIEAGNVPVSFLTREEEFQSPPGDEVAACQSAIAAADHLVLVYPLWLGTLPARLKAWLEEIGRNQFLIGPTDGPGWPVKKMKGKTARIIVTMGMPGIAYRLFFGAHSVKALEAGVLKLSGFGPVRHTILGTVADPKRREAMLLKVAALGEDGG